MLALMTQSVLDVGFGIIWWTVKKTGSAISYGIDYLWSEPSDDVISMTEFRELLEEKNKKIKTLSDKLDALEI